MKKRLIALFMILILTLTAFTGCGKDKKEEEKSSYFKELNELSSLDLGTAKINYDLKIKSDMLATMDELSPYLDKDGNMSVQLTVDTVCESKTKNAFDISAKVGDAIDGKMLTVVVDDKIVYVDFAGLIDTVKKIAGEEATKEIEAFGTAISLDVDKLATEVTGLIKAMSTEGALEVQGIMDLIEKTFSNNEKIEEQVNKFAKDLVNSADKNYKNLTGKDGDMYTLTISNENIEKIIDDTANFLKNDGAKLMEALVDMLGDIIKETGTSPEEVKEQIPSLVEQAATTIQESKDEIVAESVAVDFNIVSKIKVDEGKSAKFALETNDITLEDNIKMSINVSADYKVGTTSIAEKIPQNPFDITNLVTYYLKEAVENPELINNLMN